MTERMVIKVTKCNSRLQFVSQIKNVTHKSLLESKNIADSVWDGKRTTGTLCLNESSITVDQWLKIVEPFSKNEFEWEIVK